MNELSLFTGAGGGLLGTSLLGFRHVGYVERDAYCQAVLQARIRDGFLDPAPIFGDIREFLADGWADRYRGLVDVVTGGFPCQPHSVAGKQLGADDPRDMWPETADVLRRIRPPFAFLENVPGLASSGYLGRVLGDLAELGFDAEWTVRSAADAGAPHLRKRLWILAVRGFLSDSERELLRNESGRIGGARWAGAAELADDGGEEPVADASRVLSGRTEQRAERERARQGGEHVADSARYGRREGRSKSARIEGRSRASKRGARESLANSNGGRLEGERVGGLFDGERAAQRNDVDGCGGEMADADRARFANDCRGAEDGRKPWNGAASRGGWWAHDPAEEGGESESFVGRVAHGVACRVVRLRAIGNGQVPAVVVSAWRELVMRVTDRFQSTEAV